MAILSRARFQRSQRNMRAFCIFTVVVIISWIIGLVIFIDLIPQEVANPDGTTDAVVVLTGGSMRLETGLMLWQAGHGRKLFISGVHRGVEVAELLNATRRSPEELNCCVKLGYLADNTVGNARETVFWMREEGFSSLRLVTASYHMPRSVEEFRAASSDLTIVQHPVFPVHVKTNQWWRWPGTTLLIIGEYHKYLITRFRCVITYVGNRVRK